MTFTSLLLPVALAFASSTDKDYPSLSEDQIRAYDLDHDGVLEPNEIKAAFLALAIEAESDVADEMDTDDDGQVTTTEMQTYFVALPYADEVVAAAKRSDAWNDFVQKFDANGDGKIGQTEAVRAYEYTKTLAEEKYQAADANGDGKLDSSEVKNAAESLKSSAAAGEKSAMSPYDRATTQKLFDFQSKLTDGPAKLFDVARGSRADVFDLATFGSDSQRRAALGVLNSPKSRGLLAGRRDAASSALDKNAQMLQGFSMLGSSMHKNPRFNHSPKPSLMSNGPTPRPKSTKRPSRR
ncbi:MAG: hypothetical protein HY292_10180 [Planctomycetes bacterium]|nr:hypothetical protein [Planctomycetota bacterium]